MPSMQPIREEDDSISDHEEEPSPKVAVPKKPKSSASKKRGPPRPHRNVPETTLQVRLAKLQKRIDKSRAQFEEATRHIEGYQREVTYRAADAPSSAGPDVAL
jgi:hypothetical protein